MTASADAPASALPWFKYAIVGVVGGLLSGAFGVGGGIVMVPLLVMLVGMDQRRASATSLAAIVPTSIVGATQYALQGEVDWLAALFAAIGGVIGAWLGARLLRRIPMTVLRWLFIGLIVVVAVRMALVEAPRSAGHVPFEWWTPIAMIAFGVMIGVLSGLFGIGGGIIAVPGLVALFGVGDLVAKGTSLVIMFPTSVSGTLSNWRAKLVDLRAGLVIGLAAVVASFGGVWFAHWIPASVSGWLFAALLLVAAWQMTVKAIRAQRQGK